MTSALACVRCGDVSVPDRLLCQGCLDDDSHAAEERRYAEALYRLGGDERGSVGSGLACSLGLFAAFVLVFTSPLWLIALALGGPAAWVVGAALWDLCTAPREDPYLSAWDIRSSHTPDRKRVTR